MGGLQYQLLGGLLSDAPYQVPLSQAREGNLEEGRQQGATGENAGDVPTLGIHVFGSIAPSP